MGGKQPLLGASSPLSEAGGSGCPQSSPTALPALVAHGNFPERAGKTPGHAQQSQASVAHPAAVRGVKQRETQDWEAGHPGSLPASASALAVGEEPEPCASVYPVLRGETPDGVFAPHRIWGEFFPSKGSKALKYPLSSVPMHPPKRGLCTVCCCSVPPKWHCLGARHWLCREGTCLGAPQPSQTPLSPPLGTGTPCTHMLWECPSFTEPVLASDPWLGQTRCLPSTHPALGPAPCWQHSVPGASEPVPSALVPRSQEHGGALGEQALLRLLPCTKCPIAAMMPVWCRCWRTGTLEHREHCCQELLGCGILTGWRG